MFQTYAHHLIGLAGQLMSLQAGGTFGTICQISFFTEASTPFVNGRQILVWHHLEDTSIYIANGLMMTVSFFWVRVVFYGYMILGKCRHWAFIEPNFWETYYPDTSSRVLAQVCITLYSLMYLLQLFWFYKIFTGLLKAVGCMKSGSKKVKKTE